MIRKKPHYFYKQNFVAQMLIPLSLVYILVFAIIKFKFSKPKKICKKTVCIGNIVLGGSGKTPICIEICKEIQRNNKNVCFITKGYNRKKKNNLIIPKNHNLLFDYKEVGDESLILSEYADVFVVNKRKQAKVECYDVTICDDGYFDNTIKKDCNIVIFNGDFFIGNGYVFPSGNLRYRLKSLRNANYVIITNATNENFVKYKQILSKYIEENKIFNAKLQVNSIHDKQKKYLAFAGIGENQNFFNALKEYGLIVQTFISYEDHQEYHKNLLNFIKQQYEKYKVDKIITTRKDFVKLPKQFCKECNVEAFDICYKIDNINEIVSFILNGK